MSSNRYDVIIVGTGAGGGTLLSKLAGSGKRILVLERGGFLPREKENWSAAAVFKENRYHTTEVWRDQAGKDIHPGTGYWVGGNTKVYGAALFRLRPRDFEDVRHEDGGISAAWPITYAELEPYYQAAEVLYNVHGRVGEDPTEGPRSAPYPFAPVTDEPRIAELRQAIRAQGLHPFSIPLGLDLDEQEPLRSPCIKCSTCDSFPCLLPEDHPARAGRSSMRNLSFRRRRDDVGARRHVPDARRRQSRRGRRKFFPSSGAINPSLTIIANALRVGDHLLARLGCSQRGEDHQ